MVERPGTSEHPVHGRDARGVPSRYIRVEGSFVVEQLAHVRHQRHVPVRHLGSPRGAAVRAVAATRHAGGIDGDAVVHRGLQRITCPKSVALGVHTERGSSPGPLYLPAPHATHQLRQHALVLQAGPGTTKRSAARPSCRSHPFDITGEPGVGAREHPRRVRVVGEGPARNVPVEAGGALKHTLRVVTCDISHWLMSTLNCDLPWNRKLMSVTRETSQWGMVASHSRSPTHASTAALSSALVVTSGMHTAFCQYPVGARRHALQHVPGVARGDAGRAAHEGVGAGADGAVEGRIGRVARVVLARPPATGEGVVVAAREPRLPCVCRTKDI